MKVVVVDEKVGKEKEVVVTMLVLRLLLTLSSRRSGALVSSLGSSVCL